MAMIQLRLTTEECDYLLMAVDEQMKRDKKERRAPEDAEYPSLDAGDSAQRKVGRARMYQGMRNNPSRDRPWGRA